MAILFDTGIYTIPSVNKNDLSEVLLSPPIY